MCGELVKAGNASPCYIEPLDWSIIILGTHPFPFLPVCLTPASPPLPRPPSLRGSLHLRVIVAVMTYLALSSAPGSTNTHADRRTPGTRTHTTGCERTHAEHTSFSPPPSLLGPPSRRTDWEQSLNAGRRLHSLLLLPLFFLPPLTQHPSLSISITPAAFHRLSLLYPLPSPLLLRLPLFSASLSTGPPPAFPFSFFFLSTYEVQTSAPSSPPCLPLFVFLFYFISEFHLGERGIQQVRSDKKQIKVITQSSPRSLARCSSIYNIFFNTFFFLFFLSFFRTAETRAKRH